MTTLVTGGAGLIGSHVVDLLADSGRDVRVIDALTAPTHHGPPDWLRPDVEYLFADIRDPTALAKALQGVDTVVHLAAFGGFAPGVEPYLDVNVRAYGLILDVAAQVGAPLRRTVVASSQAVYGEGWATCPEHGRFHPGLRLLPQLEAGRWQVRCFCGLECSAAPSPESATAPRSAYAVSKLCLEQVALRLGEAQGIGTTVLRFALTYGRRQSASNPYCGILPIFSQRLRRGLPLPVYEDGAQMRDLVHVTDVARAVVLATEDDRAAGRVLNVGTGVGTKLMALVGALARAWNVEPAVWLPGWFRPGDMRHLIADATALRSLGWAPTVQLADGLADYVDWARDRSWPDLPLDEAMDGMRAAGVIGTTKS